MDDVDLGRCGEGEGEVVVVAMEGCSGNSPASISYPCKQKPKREKVKKRRNIPRSGYFTIFEILQLKRRHSHLEKKMLQLLTH